MTQEQKPLPTLGLQDAMLAMEDEKTEMDKVLELVLDPKNIAHFTELTKDEITAFSVLSTMTERHNLPVLRSFLAHNLVLRISKSRSGRKELIKIVGRHLAMEGQQGIEMDSKAGWRRFVGRR